MLLERKKNKRSKCGGKCYELSESYTGVCFIILSIFLRRKGKKADLLGSYRRAPDILIKFFFH